MILWTIQAKAAYDRMIETGVLRADPEHLFCENDFPNSYVWMSNQMRQHIGPAPEGVEFPVWAWYEWEGKRKRPDMRTHGRGWSNKGTPIVLLTVNVPDEKVMLTDFDYWNIIINRTQDPENVRVTKSDIKLLYGIRSKKMYSGSCQATMWEIKLEWVKEAEFFISR